MDKNNEYFPKTPREKVIIYQLLSELNDFTYRTNSHIFGVLPVTTDIPKTDIYRWIKEQHKLLEEDEE